MTKKPVDGKLDPQEAGLRDPALGALLRKNLGDAPEAPFLEQRIWRAIESDGKSARHSLPALRILASVMGVVSVVAFTFFMERAPDPSGMSHYHSPVAASSPAVKKAAEKAVEKMNFETEFLEGLSGFLGSEEDGEFFDVI